DLTATATWASSNDGSVASISNAAGSQGLASAFGTGTTEISATIDAIVGSTTLTVTDAVVLSITLMPANASLAAGHSQHVNALASFSGGHLPDVTNAAAWFSRHPPVPTISNAPGSPGLATGHSAGTTDVSALFGEVIGSTTLTVTDTSCSAGPFVCKSS